MAKNVLLSAREVSFSTNNKAKNCITCHSNAQGFLVRFWPAHFDGSMLRHMYLADFKPLQSIGPIRTRMLGIKNYR